MFGVSSMQRERRSTFTLSEESSLQTQDFTPKGKPLGRVLHVLLRAGLRVGKGCAWLALLGLLHSVPLWLGILVGYWFLRRLLSVLRGGTEWSLAPMLLGVLLLVGRSLVNGAIRIWHLWPRFTLKPPWSFLALGCWGVLLLYEWVICLSEWGS
jgi:hypothetical protein